MTSPLCVAVKETEYGASLLIRFQFPLPDEILALSFLHT